MKIFCVGRNYVEHAKELNNEVPVEPVIFMKPSTALIHYSSPFFYPEFTNDLHYEIELVLRISKNGKHIPEEDAYQYYNSITVGIDFTARDIQKNLKDKGLPWEKAKAWDNSALVGDWISFESLAFGNRINFSLEKNAQAVQKGDSSLMLFSFDKIIANISNYFSLNIGDLIFTGTPKGVGKCVIDDELCGYLEGKKLFAMSIK